MKRAQMLSGTRPGPSEASARRREDLSRFAPKPESLVLLWSAAEKKIARLVDSIRASRGARPQSQINKPTGLVIETELESSRDHTEVEILAEAIVSLVRKLEEDNQQAEITVEEASFALHFRRSKDEVRRALLLLERQGIVKQVDFAGRWLFLV